MNTTNKTDLLLCIENQELVAKKFGFYWENIHQLIEQIQNECQEVEEAWDSGDAAHLQEEIGDLILASVSLAVFCKQDPHDTVSKSIDKFQRRYDAVVRLAKADGKTSLHGEPFDLLMKYWNEAKRI